MGPQVPTKWGYLFAVVAANAADLDFVPGLMVGNVNLFHRGVSHSFAAALVFGLLAGLVSRLASGTSWRIGLAAIAIYSSHLVLDFFTSDIRAPFGSPLLWPFLSDHFISPWTVFGGIKHGVPGESVWEITKQVFSWTNAAAIGLESLVLLPVLAITWILFRSSRGTAGPGA